MVDKSVQKIYGDRVRVRACGLCSKGSRLLLVNHAGLYKHDFWAPPGGGIEFGQSIASTLVREFGEETGLRIKVGEFQFACEFIHPPFHAVELFFRVSVTGGSLSRGSDPEMSETDQLIKDVKYLTDVELGGVPRKHKHGLFKVAKTIEKVQGLKGYLKI